MVKRLAVFAIVVGLALASFASGALAGGAQPPNENASCVGFLANAANPNAGFVLQNLVFPAVGSEAAFGELQSSLAQQHSGSLDPCIPF